MIRTRPGRKRHDVTVQEFVVGSPQELPNGEPNATWVDYAVDVSASIDPVLGQEYFAAKQVQSKVNTKIRMWWEEGVNDRLHTGMRILHGETIYNVESAVDVEMAHQEWLLYCSSGVNLG